MNRALSCGSWSAGKLAVSFALALAATCALPPTLDAQDLYLTNARLVDPEVGQIREGSLLVRDGRVVGSPETAPAGFEGPVLDLDGRWVMPGLVDLHTHSYGNMAPGNVFDGVGTEMVARRMLYAGVFAFLDLFGREESMFSIRSAQRAGQVPGADLFISASCLTATEGHCTEYGIPTRTMDTPDEARAHVSELAREGADVIKIVYAPTGNMPSIDKATLAAALETARDAGVPTVIHINTWQDVRDAVELGASAVTHVPSREPIPDDIPALMAERGTVSVPTLAVETDFPAFVTEPEVLDNPMARALTTGAILDAYRSEETRTHVAESASRAAVRHTNILAAVKAIFDAGVTVLSGTDSGNWGTIQGYSMHRELVKLVAAGLTPWEALAASTTGAAEFLGLSYGFTPGDVGNFLVLDRSPLEDIRNTQTINMLIQRGRILDREALLTPPAGS